MKNFSEHLKLIRISKNLTQKQVAEGIDIKESAYQRYERGAGKPAFEKLIALADYFDVSLDYLVDRDWKTKEKL